MQGMTSQGSEEMSADKRETHGARQWQMALYHLQDLGWEVEEG